MSADRLYARYRDDHTDHALDGIDWNPVLETLLTHRSVRSYSDRALPQGLLTTIVAAAQSAPTSSNLQAWSVIAVEDAARRQRLSALAANQRHVAQAPLLLMFIADLSRLRGMAQRRDAVSEGLDFLEMFILAVADAAFAAQNALVALESLGLGGCYIGAMRNHPQEVAEELALPPEAFVVFGLTIGYPDPAVPTDVKPRLPQAVVLHREQYSTAADEQVDGYDTRMRGFRGEQQMPGIDWTEQAVRRVRDGKAISGRDKLAEILRGRGFGLK